ncbi:MAG: 1-acyl-sn-glycerol-3-phosphate acyltransferase [Myxococcota bacterium]
MTKSQPVVVEATNRLAGFNSERTRILEEVHRRVVDACVEAAAQDGDASLEYTLNDVAFSEIRRLESSKNRNNQRRLARWRDMANRLLRMSETEKLAELESLTRYYCRDVVGNFNPRVFRFATGVMPPALSFLLSPVSSWREGIAALTEVSEKVEIQGPIDAIRLAGERGTLIVTPTHSSNLDSIILGFGLHLAGLPPVTYGAGKNLFTNPFISYFMRNLGAYRVDRRLRFQLYKDVLKEYSTVLLERGFHSLFFPGGTRSRSNRVESRLKLGLLGTGLSAYRNNVMAGMPQRRVYIVPVTINYRLVLEAETLIEDHLAETGKSRYIIDDDEFSRLGRLVEFARKIMVKKGSAILRFGTPFDPFGNPVDEQGESHDRRGRPVDPSGYLKDRNGSVVAEPQRDAEYTRILGRNLAEVYQRDTVVLATHIVSRAIFDELSAQVGTRDIYRLLRMSGDATRLSVARVCAAVGRLCKRIRSQPALGVLSEAVDGMPPAVVVGEALISLNTYHTRAVIVRHGDHLQAQGLRLLYYYQNRLSHVPCENGGAA